MSKRMFFFDIDGTLIDLARNVYEPTPATVESFRQLHEQGDYVVLATGRAKSLIPLEVMSLQFDGFICSNGGYVTFQDKVIENSYFTIPEMELLEAYTEQVGAQLIFEEQEHSHVKNPNVPYVKEFLNIFHNGNDIFDDCWDFTKYRPTMGNLIFDHVESMDRFKAIAEKDFDVYLFKEKTLYADVTHKGVSKGKGVDSLIHELGIARKNTYAFGDGLNDIQMFQKVAHAFAMGYAKDKVKNMAHYTTDSCENDGIFNALVLCGAIKAF